ncbi:uncharacterized protein METZ01_LOCUS308495 [marine metagenome]|uniref:Uncharacterized protein n=1 Tax=marine metagenome TaxID=408172 RepID=A0A382N7W9_9ZZZZ
MKKTWSGKLGAKVVYKSEKHPTDTPSTVPLGSASPT